MITKAEKVELIHLTLSADFSCIPELKVEVYSDEFPYDRAEGVVYKNRFGKGPRTMKYVVKLGDMWTEINESSTPSWTAHCIYERGISDEQIGEVISRMYVAVKSILSVSVKHWVNAAENMVECTPEECARMYREKAPIGESGSPETEDGVAFSEQELANDLFNQACVNGEVICKARGIDEKKWHSCITSMVSKDELRKIVHSYHSKWAGEYAIFHANEEKKRFISSLATKLSGDCMTKLLTVLEATGGAIPAAVVNRECEGMPPMPMNSTLQDAIEAAPPPAPAEFLNK